MDYDEIVPESNTFDAEAHGHVHRSVVIVPLGNGDGEFMERRARFLESLNNSFGMKADIRQYTNEEEIPAMLEDARKRWVQAIVVYPRSI